MKKPERRASWLIVTLGLSLTFAASAATVRVPQDQATITAGIAAANSGDTVAVSAGTYYEFNIQITNAITVASLSGPTNTIIDSQTNGRSFIVSNATLGTVNINGFTIQNGYASQIRGGACEIASGQCTISNCIVQGVSGDSSFSAYPIS